MLELQTLQREYRRMDIDRRAYAEQSQAVLRKQQITIDKFKKDNETLKNDIAMIMRASNRPMTANQQETVQAITDVGDKYATAIEYERQNIATMEEQIAILRQKALQQRKAMGGVNASKENHYMIIKQIKILENRLDKSLIKFNEAVSMNKELRDQIDDLRRERVVFENIYRKMERELVDRKKDMAAIIEASNQAYEQRDAFQMEVAAIEQANRKEGEDFDEQMAALAHMLDIELQLPTVGATLGQKAKSLTKLSKSQLLSPIDMRSSKSAGSLDDSSVGLNGTATTPKEVDYKERVQNFEEAFNKIRAATGISDINNLVNIFIKNEEHNFSLFNYVNEQNNEIEKLEEQILALREEENKYKLENGADVSQHKEILKDLEAKLQYTDTMAEKYELKCQDLSRIIEALKRGMQGLVMKVEIYNHDHEQQQEGAAAATATYSPPTITEINMVTYLGMLEHKAISLLQQYNALHATMVGEEAHAASMSAPPALAASLVSVLGSGPKVPMGTEHIHINPPKADDYRSDDDSDEGNAMFDEDDTRPFTREELKYKTLSKLQKKMGLAMSGMGGVAGDASKKKTTKK